MEKSRIFKRISDQNWINTGYCNVGNFGSQRLTYTIIGGEVCSSKT